MLGLQRWTISEGLHSGLRIFIEVEELLEIWCRYLKRGHSEVSRRTASEEMASRSSIKESIVRKITDKTLIEMKGFRDVIKLLSKFSVLGRDLQESMSW